MQMTMMAEKSKSVPFMPQPANLDGSLAGDVGFDPLGFSDWIDVRFLREAELKHGRMAQMAWLGYVAVDNGLRFDGVPEVGSLAAHDAAVAFGSLPQVLLFISFAEAISTVGVVQMLEGSGRAPGDFGFDPLKIKGDAKKKADMELKEITHCRLAMLAFSGVVTQSALGAAFPYTSL